MTVISAISYRGGVVIATDRQAYTGIDNKPEDFDKIRDFHRGLYAVQGDMWDIDQPAQGILTPAYDLMVSPPVRLYRQLRQTQDKLSRAGLGNQHPFRLVAAWIKPLFWPKIQLSIVERGEQNLVQSLLLAPNKTVMNPHKQYKTMREAAEVAKTQVQAEMRRFPEEVSGIEMQAMDNAGVKRLFLEKSPYRAA